MGKKSPLEIKYVAEFPLRVWCDKLAIDIANDPVQHDRKKHVEIIHFFIKREDR